MERWIWICGRKKSIIRDKYKNINKSANILNFSKFLVAILDRRFNSRISTHWIFQNFEVPYSIGHFECRPQIRIPHHKKTSSTEFYGNPLLYSIFQNFPCPYWIDHLLFFNPPWVRTCQIWPNFSFYFSRILIW